MERSIELQISMHRKRRKTTGLDEAFITKGRRLKIKQNVNTDVLHLCMTINTLKHSFIPHH